MLLNPKRSCLRLLFFPYALPYEPHLQSMVCRIVAHSPRECSFGRESLPCQAGPVPGPKAKVLRSANNRSLLESCLRRNGHLTSNLLRRACQLSMVVGRLLDRL
ncbi:hypothetical protein CMEL01_00686 [Colletotrichum melonis]|uniref:Uncharacterized protein n=2 Tax=Colletotrichum acutatum species complex TaxID=2707335 RepID=A0AAI9V538_9PEZI|nr:hypothetical protein CMEL01_00686 [Colletotrichum melonis]